MIFMINLNITLDVNELLEQFKEIIEIMFD